MNYFAKKGQLCKIFWSRSKYVETACANVAKVSLLFQIFAQRLRTKAQILLWNSEHKNSDEQVVFRMPKVRWNRSDCCEHGT